MGKGVGNHAKVSKEATEFKVSVSYHKMRGYQIYFPRPIVEHLGIHTRKETDPKPISFIKGHRVEVRASTGASNRFNSERVELSSESARLSDWRKDLDEFMAKKESEKATKEKLAEEKRARDKAFVAEKLVPALEEVKSELEKHGREVSVSASDDRASIRVSFKGRSELDLTIDASLGTDEIFTNKTTGGTFSAKGHLGSGYPSPKPETITKDEIVVAVVSRFKDRL